MKNLTIPETQEYLKKHFGMYVIYATEESLKEDYDYLQWSKPTVLNGIFINNLPNIDGLKNITVYFHEPIVQIQIL